MSGMQLEIRGGEEMKIVVGYDGSEHGRRAVLRAADLAGTGGEVTVVAAVAIAAHAGRGPGRESVDPAEKSERDRALAEARELLTARGIAVRTVEGLGRPATAIVDEAREWNADLIVVGTRGRNLAERVLLGSVSTAVAHHAPCDVLIVR
jgi:nucleotide-binding universal stress UspA family protein